MSQRASKEVQVQMGYQQDKDCCGQWHEGDDVEHHHKITVEKCKFIQVTRGMESDHQKLLSKICFFPTRRSQGALEQRNGKNIWQGMLGEWDGIWRQTKKEVVILFHFINSSLISIVFVSSSIKNQIERLTFFLLVGICEHVSRAFVWERIQWFFGSTFN